MILKLNASNNMHYEMVGMGIHSMLFFEKYSFYKDKRYEE